MTSCALRMKNGVETWSLQSFSILSFELINNKLKNNKYLHIFPAMVTKYQETFNTIILQTITCCWENSSHNGNHSAHPGNCSVWIFDFQVVFLGQCP